MFLFKQTFVILFIEKVKKNKTNKNRKQNRGKTNFKLRAAAQNIRTFNEIYYDQEYQLVFSQEIKLCNYKQDNTQYNGVNSKTVYK